MVDPLTGVGTRVVDVYCLELERYKRSMDEQVGCLSDDEARHLGSLRFGEDRLAYAVSHAFCRRTMAQYLERSAHEIVFERSTFGRPAVRAQKCRLAFSLSHCRTHAALAIASVSEVGVDVESVRAGIDGIGIARRHFTSHEAADLAALPRVAQESGFVRLWTCKEAFIKAIGRGLSYPLDRFSVIGVGAESVRYSGLEACFGPDRAWKLLSLRVGPNAWLAVAVRQWDVDVRLLGPDGGELRTIRMVDCEGANDGDARVPWVNRE